MVSCLPSLIEESGPWLSRPSVKAAGDANQQEHFFESASGANHVLLRLGSRFRSPRTPARTSPSATPLLTCRPRARLSVPSTSSAARRSWSARSPSSLLASPSRTTRTRRVLLVRAPVARALAAVLPGAAVAVVVAVVAALVVV